MVNFGGANRIELESQILCAALRQSWADTDAIGMVKACQELSNVFPDLLPAPSAQLSNPSNCYDVLGIDCDVNTPRILAAYFRAIKKFLRENPKPRTVRDEYYELLNAGFILRKPRSRLSHDLIVVRGALLDGQVIPQDGTLRIIEAPAVVQPATAQEIKELEATATPHPKFDIAAALEQGVYEEPVQESVEEESLKETYEQQEDDLLSAEFGQEMVAPRAVEKPSAEQPEQEALPILIDLLQQAQFIGPAEIQALMNQTRLYPDIQLADLILHSGYASRLELKSFQLAEFLITSGKITMDQFQIILDEKRTWTNLYYPRED
ncbi:MAG: hypothetical protein SGJ27_22060 [Candidatus Melainabacteria bacterium]|nr:hypothetical protein [Candidatus Melainabacteria bacterium]